MGVSCGECVVTLELVIGGREGKVECSQAIGRKSLLFCTKLTGVHSCDGYHVCEKDVLDRVHSYGMRKLIRFLMLQLACVHCLKMSLRL